MKLRDLNNVSLIGLGLLGGSLGLALDSLLPNTKRFGYSHRLSTRQKAMENGSIDVNCSSIRECVEDAQLVILASPIGTFKEIMQEMAEYLPKGCVVTDVGSTKVLPVKWARQFLPKQVEFLGSHPMAGSEQRGIEFAMADLFNDAHCILTPTRGNRPITVKFLEEFWTLLGMRVTQMTPIRHDKVVGKISHLPHILAMSLVNISQMDDILLCGKGFLDTTRIASGPTGVWRDILMGNAQNSIQAIDQLIKELKLVKKALQTENEKQLVKKLDDARHKRNELVSRKIKQKELLS